MFCPSSAQKGASHVILQMEQHLGGGQQIPPALLSFPWRLNLVRVSFPSGRCQVTLGLGSYPVWSRRKAG